MIPMSLAGHHPISSGRRAPARLTLPGTSSRNRTGISSLWGKRLAARRSWLESLEPPAGLAPTSLAYRARVLRLDEGGLEPMAGVEPALRSYQDRGLPLSDTGVVPTRGVAPLSLPGHGSGLRLTYAGLNWSGSGDLHAALPAPQAGGTLSSLEPEIFGVIDRTRTG